MRRTKEEAARTRQDIFEAGLRVFSEKGFAAATMSDVAREAGTTRGAIYWHFRNKEAFFKEILDRLSRQYKGFMAEAAESKLPFLEVLRNAIKTLLRQFAQDPQFRAMQELTIRSALNRDGMITPEIQFEHDSMGYEVIQRAMKEGKVFSRWNGATAFFALTAVISGAFIQMIDLEMKPTETQIEELADFVVRGFQPASSGLDEG
ncbi:MAG: TetR family transcriptional regulator [Spirochaetaceae bacterium]